MANAEIYFFLGIKTNFPLPETVYSNDQVVLVQNIRGFLSPLGMDTPLLHGLQASILLTTRQLDVTSYPEDQSESSHKSASYLGRLAAKQGEEVAVLRKEQTRNKLQNINNTRPGEHHLKGKCTGILNCASLQA